MAAAYPPGGTIVQSFKRSFTDVPVAADDAISTTEFLDAAESLTIMFDTLGSVAFAPVKKDILSNVAKLRAQQQAAPAESATVQDLVRNELKGKKHTATEGGLWLVRGLDFTAKALTRNLANGSEELADSFRGAYGETLKPHHSFLIKPVFSAAMSATPYRADFYTKLGDSPEQVNTELGLYLEALTKIVAILSAFFASKEAKW
ncbi:glycolipid transfer protein domain-containing protein [Dactylonectria estremocensis]|uniref:Glycolipid transfer protein domain-containing protein n=1 Tax=Dactylonectria estremocensis TaxID=1079267 RepID=A0A9P9FEX2_9HYPO|nr:glycolipid transfer protein domain-containing protein [Dactylonectria estremocensis]